MRSFDPTEPIVGDAVDVDDPSECYLFIVSIEEFSSEDQETTSDCAYLRFGQEKYDHLQNVCFALRSVIKSWGVDEGHLSPVEDELVRDPDIGRTRL